MSREYGAVEDYNAGELVVALGDEGLVCRALTDLQVEVGLPVEVDEREEDPRLGLALLTLKIPDNAKDSLSDLAADATRAKELAGQPTGTRPSALDLILFKLRKDFSEKYAGWIPEIGKNRLISPVRGLPYVSGCAKNDPSQLGLDDPISVLASGGQGLQGLGWPQPRPTEPGHGVRVGLLDTKVYPDAWFGGGYLASEGDLLKVPGSDGKPPLSLEGHGTFAAGLILRQAPGARLIIRPVLRDNALGTTWGVAKKMAEFVGTGVNILNLSFGCYTDDGQPPLVLAKAVSVVSPRILLVAAAGNHGNIVEERGAADPPPPWTVNLKDTTPVWPAAFAEVTAVGATDATGTVADFSPKVPWVDVTAPGVDVESIYLSGTVRLTPPKADPPTQNFGGAARWKGTSFAAATVSGAVAASIGPGRDARQALEYVLADPDQYRRIEKYVAPQS